MEIKKLCKILQKDYPAVAFDIHNGNDLALSYLVGCGMRISKGSVNASEIKKKLLKQLRED